MNKQRAMKTMTARMCLSCFLAAVFCFANSRAIADFMPVAPSPYTFGPAGRPIEDLRDFGKPNQMMSILPNRPVAAHDKYGNRIYVSPNGKMTVQINTDGSLKISISGKSIYKDKEGNVTQVNEAIKGTNRVVIKNGNGEITGYQQLGFGGNVTRAYDASGNLTQTYAYDKYGKNVQWILNELSQTKTVYSSNGEPSVDINFEGAEVARYQYDKNNRLQSKTDQYGDITYYNSNGNMTYSENSAGEKITQYYYKNDSEGRCVLEKAVDISPGVYSGDVTYFENGRIQKTVSRYGDNAKEYYYEGTALRYVFNTRTQEVTWYDLNGKETYTTLNGEITKESLYYKSRLVGYYDNSSESVVLYQYERQDQVVRIYTPDGKPTAEAIEAYYEKNNRMSDIDTTTGKDAAIKEGIIKVKKSLGVLSQAETAARNAAISTAKLSTFKTVNDSGESALSANSGKETTKYNYDNTGRLQSTVSRATSDATGWVTTFYFGEVTSGHDRTSVTVSGDQSKNTLLVDKLWNSILNEGKSISDISSGSGELATFAKSVKSLNINSYTLASLSNTQIINLFGWRQDGTGTSYCITDVRARAANAGRDGTISVTFGLDNGGLGTHIYAAAVTAADSASMVVGGTQSNQRLDITSEKAYLSVTSSKGEAFTVATSQQSSSVTNTSDEQWNKIQASAASAQTVNGVTRLYASNGNILAEKNTFTEEKTFYNTYGKVSEVYAANNILTQKYYYGSDGKVSAIKQYNSSSKQYETVFYIGWGVAGQDQTAITVDGDQTSNISQVCALLKAVASGTNISALPSDLSTFATDFVKTIKTINLNPAVISKLTDAQLCNLFGWDKSASKTAENITKTRKLAQNAGIEGTLTVTYGYNKDSNGATGNHIYAAELTAKNGAGQSVLVDNSYAIDASASNTVLSTAVEEAVATSGISLIKSLTSSVNFFIGGIR